MPTRGSTFRCYRVGFRFGLKWKYDAVVKMQGEEGISQRRMLSGSLSPLIAHFINSEPALKGSFTSLSHIY